MTSAGRRWSSKQQHLRRARGVLAVLAPHKRDFATSATPLKRGWRRRQGYDQGVANPIARARAGERFGRPCSAGRFRGPRRYNMIQNDPAAPSRKAGLLTRRRFGPGRGLFYCMINTATRLRHSYAASARQRAHPRLATLALVLASLARGSRATVEVSLQY